ncbi:MAG TPA: hypothetical protein PK230_15990 [Chitinophagales bacterium]|nr:hypothetical protein [Chitinophagales bacterium]
MKKVLMFVALCAILGGVYGYYLWNKPTADASSQSTDFEVESTALYQEYGNNAAEADAKYLDKAIVVVGTIATAPSTTESGLVSITLDGGEMGGVNCELSPEASKASVNNFQMGQKAKIKGICSGFNDIDVVLNRCVVLP